MKLEYSQYYFIKAPGKQDSIFLLILMNKNLIFACFLPNVIFTNGMSVKSWKIMRIL